MGEARRRGTFEERKAHAPRKVKPVRPSRANFHQMTDFMGSVTTGMCEISPKERRRRRISNKVSAVARRKNQRQRSTRKR